MDQTLYEHFSQALQSLAGDDLASALDRVEHVVNLASRDHGPNDIFPQSVATGRPADRLLRLFQGYTVGEVAAVMGRLRGELADELARRRAPADVVRELREGGTHGRAPLDDQRD